MKITGLKPVDLAPGISALAVAEFNLPLDFLLANSVTKLDYQNLTGENLPFQQPGFVTEDGFFPIKKMSVLRKGRRFSFNGLFSYNSTYDLAEYLAKYYQPLSNTKVDSLIKRLKGKSPAKKLVSELIETLDKEGNRPMHRFRYDDDCIAWFPRFQAGDERSHLDVKPYDVNGQRMFLRTARRESRLWIWEKSSPRRNGSIPQYDFILIRGRDEKVLIWNGEKIEVKMPEFLEKKELVGFEDQGWIINADKFDPLPRPELQIEFFLRVPAREEAGDVALRKFTKCKNPRAQTPLFIFDLKRAIQVASDPEFIENPREVLSILSRTKDNIYVPGDAVYDLNVYLQDKPYFLAAMRIQ